MLWKVLMPLSVFLLSSITWLRNKDIFIIPSWVKFTNILPSPLPVLRPSLLCPLVLCLLTKCCDSILCRHLPDLWTLCCWMRALFFTFFQRVSSKLALSGRALGPEKTLHGHSEWAQWGPALQSHQRKQERKRGKRKEAILKMFFFTETMHVCVWIIFALVLGLGITFFSELVFYLFNWSKD